MEYGQPQQMLQYASVSNLNTTSYVQLTEIKFKDNIIDVPATLCLKMMGELFVMAVSFNTDGYDIVIFCYSNHSSFMH